MGGDPAGTDRGGVVASVIPVWPVYCCHFCPNIL